MGWLKCWRVSNSGQYKQYLYGRNYSPVKTIETFIWYKYHELKAFLMVSVADCVRFGAFDRPSNTVFTAENTKIIFLNCLVITVNSIRTRQFRLSKFIQGLPSWLETLKFTFQEKWWFSWTLLTLSTLSNFNGLFYSLFWIKLKWSVGLKGLNFMEQLLIFTDFVIIFMAYNIF